MQPHQSFDRYVLEHPLGEGGMGAVWLARHSTLGSLHALKFLHRTTPEGRARLLREGRVMAGLRHPNLVAVTDCFEAGDQVVLVLEYVPGTTLRAVLAQGGLDSATRADLGRQILDGVAVVHRAGHIHRDLKPTNILVHVQEGRWLAKVADFGLVLASADTPAPRLTAANVAMGTPGYMSPEQLTTPHDVDARSDVFALGAILYELHSGRPAYCGKDATELRAAVFAGPPDMAPIGDERLREVIRAALHPSAASRPRDAAELLAWLDGGAPRRPPEGAEHTWRNVESEGGKTDVSLSTIAQPPHAGGGRRRLIWGLPLALLAALAMSQTTVRVTPPWLDRVLEEEVPAPAPAAPMPASSARALWTWLDTRQRPLRVGLADFLPVGVPEEDAQKVHDDVAAILEGLPNVHLVVLHGAEQVVQAGPNQSVDLVLSGSLGRLDELTVFNLRRSYPPADALDGGQDRTSRLLERRESLFDELDDMLAIVLRLPGDEDAVTLGNWGGAPRPTAPLGRGEAGPEAGWVPQTQSLSMPNSARLPPASGPTGSASQVDPGLDAVRNVVRRYQGQVMYCHERARLARPDLRGRVKLAWRIDADGRPRDVRVEEGTVDDEAFEKCLVGKVERWLFPATAQGEASQVFVFAAPEE